MYSKYYCHLLWRTRELRKSRYVAYLGGGINIQKIPVDFDDKFIEMISEGYHRVQMIDPNGMTMLDEAEVASSQNCYLVDDIKTQAQFYASNWQAPTNDSVKVPMFWLTGDSVFLGQLACPHKSSLV
mmetsp:Transcript_24622/g.58414  ORF Transcript_24622/g.58414 Transcript_24622/m.58414 type:complete len:127 (+) Transcript_24622:1652-2032(+)